MLEIEAAYAIHELLSLQSCFRNAPTPPHLHIPQQGWPAINLKMLELEAADALHGLHLIQNCFSKAQPPPPPSSQCYIYISAEVAIDLA